MSSTVAHSAATIETARKNGNTPSNETWTKREELARGFIGCLLMSGHVEPADFIARKAVGYANALLIALEEDK